MWFVAEGGEQHKCASVRKYSEHLTNKAAILRTYFTVRFRSILLPSINDLTQSNSHVTMTYLCSSFSFRFIAALAIANLAACSSSPTVPPRPVMPPTPSQFLVPTKEATDRQLDCPQLVQKVRYTVVMRNSINRVFGDEGPTAMQESKHSISNGMLIRQGGITTGYSTTTTIGGGIVNVYSDLAYRAKQINDSITNRERELNYLIRANACTELEFSGSNDYTYVIRSERNQLDSKLKDLDRWNMTIKNSQDIVNQSTTNENKMIWLNNLNLYTTTRDKIKQEVDAIKKNLDSLIAENKEAHSRAENEAIEMRRWFENNTKTPQEID